MLTPEVIASQIPYILKGTNFANLGERYEGKVRDNYTQGSQTHPHYLRSALGVRSSDCAHSIQGRGAQCHYEVLV